jgi:uncharacterized protein YoxC
MVGILVFALAIVLVTIWVSLMRVSRILGRVQDRLAEVERYTRPLGGQLGALTTAVVTGADDVSHSVDALVTAVHDHRPAASDRRR